MTHRCINQNSLDNSIEIVMTQYLEIQCESFVVHHPAFQLHFLIDTY